MITVLIVLGYLVAAGLLGLAVGAVLHFRARSNHGRYDNPPDHTTNGDRP